MEWIIIIMGILGIGGGLLTILLLRRIFQYLVVFDELLLRFMDKVQEYYEAQKKFFINLENQSNRFNKNMQNLAALKRATQNLSTVTEIMKDSTKEIKEASKTKTQKQQTQRKPLNQNDIMSALRRELNRRNKEK